MNTKITALFLSMLMGGVSLASAQSYDDDDIYFNPSKAKAPQREKGHSGKDKWSDSISGN